MTWAEGCKKHWHWLPCQCKFFSSRHRTTCVWQRLDRAHNRAVLGSIQDIPPTTTPHPLLIPSPSPPPLRPFLRSRNRENLWIGFKSLSNICFEVLEPPVVLNLFSNCGAVTAAALTAGCSSCWKSSREASRGAGLTAAASQNCSSKKSSPSPLREMRFGLCWVSVTVVWGSALIKVATAHHTALWTGSTSKFATCSFQRGNKIFREWWRPSTLLSAAEIT